MKHLWEGTSLSSVWLLPKTIVLTLGLLLLSGCSVAQEPPSQDAFVHVVVEEAELDSPSLEGWQEEVAQEVTEDVIIGDAVEQTAIATATAPVPAEPTIVELQGSQAIEPIPTLDATPAGIEPPMVETAVPQINTRYEDDELVQQACPDTYKDVRNHYLHQINCALIDLHHGNGYGLAGGPGTPWKSENYRHLGIDLELPQCTIETSQNNVPCSNENVGQPLETNVLIYNMWPGVIRGYDRDSPTYDEDGNVVDAGSGLVLSVEHMITQKMELTRLGPDNETETLELLPGYVVLARYMHLDPNFGSHLAMYDDPEGREVYRGAVLGRITPQELLRFSDTHIHVEFWVFKNELQAVCDMPSAEETSPYEWFLSQLRNNGFAFPFLGNLYEIGDTSNGWMSAEEFIETHSVHPEFFMNSEVLVAFPEPTQRAQRAAHCAENGLLPRVNSSEPSQHLVQSDAVNEALPFLQVGGEAAYSYREISL